jgi:hypothetical protein
MVLINRLLSEELQILLCYGLLIDQAEVDGVVDHSKDESMLIQ